MSTPLNRPASNDDLFLWIMHRFAEEFVDHAILKGGMSMRLIDSPRSTTDIDYVFVPYASKNEIQKDIKSILRELPSATVTFEMHSKMFRVYIGIDDASIQLEANVAMECDGVPMSTGGFATSLGQQPRVIRMMALRVSLSHKLSAWNERRLLRDIYDCYFYITRLNEKPDLHVLQQRLQSIDSRIPALEKRKSMSMKTFIQELLEETKTITTERVEDELGSLLPPEELAGLAHRMVASINKLCEWLADRDVKE